jgi:hypothetical protein
LKTDPRGARQLILGGRGRILMNAKARAGRENAWPGLFNEQPSGEFRHTEEQLQRLFFRNCWRQGFAVPAFWIAEIS